MVIAAVEGVEGSRHQRVLPPCWLQCVRKDHTCKDACDMNNMTKASRSAFIIVARNVWMRNVLDLFMAMMVTVNEVTSAAGGEAEERASWKRKKLNHLFDLNLQNLSEMLYLQK